MPMYKKLTGLRINVVRIMAYSIVDGRRRTISIHCIDGSTCHKLLTYYSRICPPVEFEAFNAIFNESKSINPRKVSKFFNNILFK